ncbi:leucine-rich repeat domain-containing protein [Paenibacillus sp. FSL H8-0537]|uniref:leucine-rich repeat domain-containing protein n=1 Tax=Paenibacillus sp. FSL H8-0537 TaxID=2921399 RepID=UPI00310197C6
MNITEDFRDERFKTYILENYCENREWIQTSDVEQIVSLQLASQKYSSLKGIEHFTSLEELDCSYNNLMELDISRNINLKKLNCNKNEIHALNLTNNRKLEALDCGFNRIQKLDVSHNAMLVKLDCYWNILTELQVDHNANLEQFNCGYNALFNLNLDQNKQLSRLDCGNNYLIALNVKECPSLLEIRCNNNHLTELDVTRNSALQSLRCFNNHIKGLDISHNVFLEELYCSENKIPKLDTSHNPKLARVDYSSNLIVEPNHTIKGVGTFVYDVALSSYSTTLQYREKELAATVAVATKADMKRLSPIIKKMWEHFDELCESALALIASLHPDEDVNELVLAELEFAEDRTFRLGYDAGDSPAGQLYIYAAFNHKLEMDSELIYEAY